MKINNHNLKEYGARVLNWVYQPNLLNRELFQPENSITPHVGPVKPEPKPMELDLEFTDKTMISNFISELLSNDINILDIDDGFLYQCWCTTLSSPVEEVYHGWYNIKIPLFVIQTTAERSIHLTEATTHIFVQGNWEVECRYEITPSVDLSSITINDYTVKNLKRNEKLVLDGVTKRVYTETNSNKYGDTKLKKNKFPTLKHGEQTIEISSLNADIWLYYQPIFI